VPWPASVAALPRRRMWRGKGWLPRHATWRGQRGYRVQKKKVRQALFLKIN
jgi:hypothetical protein